MPTDERKQLDHRDFGGAVVATALFVTATAPLMVAAVVRAPGVAALAHTGAICCSAALMLCLRGSAGARWGRVAWVVSWLHCAAVVAGVLMDVPAWVGAVARLAAAASVVAVCIALAGEARVSRGTDAARAWKAAAFAAGAGWLVFLLVQGVWNDSMEAAVRGVGGAVLLACAAGLFGPAVMVYRAASESRLPLEFRGWCTFCGYDMHTLSTRTCPECGKTSYLRNGKTAEPAEKRRGRWKPLLLHCVAAVLGGAAVGGVLPNNELHRFKPLWLLMRECRLGPHAFSSSGVMNGRGGFPPMWEVARRAETETLGRASVDRLVRESLRVQADPSEPLYMWPEVFTYLEARGLTTAEQSTMFEQHLMRFTLTLPASVPEGGHLPFTVIAEERGSMRWQSVALPVREWSFSPPTLSKMAVDGVEVPAPQRRADPVNYNPTGTFAFQPGGGLPRLPRGTGVRHIRIELKVDCWRMDPPASGQKSIAKTVVLEGEVNVTPSTSTPITTHTDPALLRPLIERWNWGYESHYTHRSFARNGLAVEAPENEPALAFDFIADVIVLDGGRETPIGRLVIPAGKREAFVSDVHSWDPSTPDEKMELLIRPTNPQFESIKDVVWAGAPFQVKVGFTAPGVPNKPPSR